ncbi:MAG: aminopeptidase P family protein [Chloroflexi bacterium]|nr:aminopeptidase P family protein [Chloroflexota bacterium]
MTEFSQKQDRIQALLAERKLDALLLRRVSSFAWAMCGAASYVNTATTNGEAALLITPSGRYLITNNIEAPRLEQEEKLAAQGWEFRVTPWHEPQDTVAELTQGLRLGADRPYPGATDLSGELARRRANLTPEEGERFRELGRLCAEAMDSAVRAVRPGQTEYQIAALLAHQAESRGVQAIVNLIATDERIFAFRHPLPTDKKLDRYAMLVLCGRRWGLVCSLTRFVHFGRLPDNLRRKAQAVAQVDATFIAATRPGRSLGEIFRRGMGAYAEAGFPDEWRLHHQGGPAGYEPREYVATPGSTDVVSVGQVYAWNPSISGTKSEDTILVGEAGNEVLTAIEHWPTLLVTVNGQTFARPAILEML